MNKLIRTGVFETNSSSQHSISIASGSEFIVDTTSLVPDCDGNIKLRGGEFGWEWERFPDAYTKANYCAVGCQHNDSRVDMLIEVIKEQTGADEVIMAVTDGSYIDHDSTEVYEPAFESKETLRNFIFNKLSMLYTGNDNESELPNFFDPPNTIYYYEMKLANSKRTFKFSIYPSKNEILAAVEKLVDYVKLGRDTWESYSAHDIDYDKQTVVLSHSNFENGAYKNVYTEPFPFEIVPLNKKEVSYVI